VELKEKFTDVGEDDSLPVLSDENRELVKDVTTGLTALGYKRGQINRALRKLEEADALDGSLEDIIKKALAEMVS
jgi:Holliday junction resolvasome RuvABC DNA-binding subunit